MGATMEDPAMSARIKGLRRFTGLVWWIIIVAILIVWGNQDDSDGDSDSPCYLTENGEELCPDLPELEHEWQVP
jgi:hypothetical protein